MSGQEKQKREAASIPVIGSIYRYCRENMNHCGMSFAGNTAYICIGKLYEGQQLD